MANQTEHDVQQHIEENTSKSKKRKGWLSKSFSIAASIASGATIGIAAKSCATALLCTAGAPATVTAIAAMASAGLVLGCVKAYKDCRTPDQESSFFCKKTAKTLAIHTCLSVATGSLFLCFGDQIAEQAGNIWDKASSLFGASPELEPTEPTAPPVTETQPKNLPAADNEAYDYEWDFVDNEFGTETDPFFIAPDAQPPADNVIDEYDLGEENPFAVAPQPADTAYTVECGDNLWNIVKDHYDLSDRALIQQYVDQIAQHNGMGSGTDANKLAIGQTLMLPDSTAFSESGKLTLDWEALDADRNEGGLDCYGNPVAPSADVTPEPAPQEIVPEETPLQDFSEAARPNMRCIAIVEPNDISFVCNIPDDKGTALIKGDKIILNRALLLPR